MNEECGTHAATLLFKESTNERRIKKNLQMNEECGTHAATLLLKESTNERRVRYARSYAAIEGIYK